MDGLKAQLIQNSVFCAKNAKPSELRHGLGLHGWAKSTARAYKGMDLGLMYGLHAQPIQNTVFCGKNVGPSVETHRLGPNGWAQSAA